MTKESTRHAGVDRPSNIALARWTAVRAASRRDFVGDSGNFERACMKAAAVALQADPPRISDALKGAESGVAHAWRGTFNEGRCEAWECATVAALLRVV